MFKTDLDVRVGFLPLFYGLGDNVDFLKSTPKGHLDFNGRAVFHLRFLFLAAARKYKETDRETVQGKRAERKFHFSFAGDCVLTTLISLAGETHANFRTDVSINLVG